MTFNWTVNVSDILTTVSLVGMVGYFIGRSAWKFVTNHLAHMEAQLKTQHTALAGRIDALHADVRELRSQLWKG